MTKLESELLEQLVIEMHNTLLGFAARKLIDKNSSDDVVQETYLAAQKNIAKMIISKNQKGWLVETLKKTILHENRAYFKYCTLIEKIAVNSVAETPHHIDYHDSDISALLNNDEYKVLGKLYIDGYSIREIAEELGISYEACKKRVQAAKRKIANALS